MKILIRIITAILVIIMISGCSFLQKGEHPSAVISGTVENFVFTHGNEKLANHEITTIAAGLKTLHSNTKVDTFFLDGKKVEIPHGQFIQQKDGSTCVTASVTINKQPFLTETKLCSKNEEWTVTSASEPPQKAKTEAAAFQQAMPVTDTEISKPESGMTEEKILPQPQQKTQKLKSEKKVTAKKKVKFTKIHQHRKTGASAQFIEIR